MKPSEFFSVLCDQIPTPIKGVTPKDFEELPPKIARLLEAAEGCPYEALDERCGIMKGTYSGAILRAALALKVTI